MQSTSSEAEHILAFGIYGSGKTNSWATIAEYYRTMETPGKFHVIGTEPGAMGRLADKYPDFHQNVEWKDIWGWMELDELTGDYLSRVERGDWIVIEGGDKPWQWVQELWDKLHGPKVDIDPNDPFSMAPDTSEVRRDWVSINKVYRNWINKLIRCPAHLFMCCPQDTLRYPDPKKPQGGWHDDKEVLEQYSRFGYRPAGQKELGHHFHTVLWCRNPAYKKWTLTTVDDHTRELLEDAEVNNFVLDYLVKVAKWELWVSGGTHNVGVGVSALGGETRDKGNLIA